MKLIEAKCKKCDYKRHTFSLLSVYGGTFKCQNCGNIVSFNKMIVDKLFCVEPLEDNWHCFYERRYED